MARKASTYRAAKRNRVLRPEEGKKGVWKGVEPDSRLELPPIRLNRSRKWPEKASYGPDAR